MLHCGNLLLTCTRNPCSTVGVCFSPVRGIHAPLWEAPSHLYEESMLHCGNLLLICMRNPCSTVGVCFLPVREIHAPLWEPASPSERYAPSCSAAFSSAPTVAAADVLSQSALPCRTTAQTSVPPSPRQRCKSTAQTTIYTSKPYTTINTTTASVAAVYGIQI